MIRSTFHRSTCIIGGIRLTRHSLPIAQSPFHRAITALRRYRHFVTVNICQVRSYSDDLCNPSTLQLQIPRLFKTASPTDRHRFSINISMPKVTAANCPFQMIHACHMGWISSPIICGFRGFWPFLKPQWKPISVVCYDAPYDVPRTGLH